MPKLEDIRQLTRSGSYEVTIPYDSIERTLKDFAEDYHLDLDPDFQRGHVWTPDQQKAFMEYLLREGKYGKVILFNCPLFGNAPYNEESRHMVLVDGKQRLTTVRKFLANELAVFDGYFLRDYEDHKKFGIFDGLKFNVNALKTRAEVLQWYLELNAGGTPHSAEEIERVRQLLAHEISMTTAAGS